MFQEDNAEETKEFFEQDIDSILHKRSHIIRVDDGNQGDDAKSKKPRARKSLFTGESAMEHADIAVDDPDFWKKVLPDLVRQSRVLRMTRLTGPARL